MKILIIDNYDSFTYNLVQKIGKYAPDITVKRNDKISLNEIKKLNPDKIVISPGPGRPEDSKISLEIIRELGKTIPVLGVCLGHQAIGIIFGGEIKNAPVLMHGKTSPVQHDDKTIFRNIPPNFTAGRYHSLIVDENKVPDILQVSATTEGNVIMGLRHKKYPIEGIQFHPESILTPEGDNILYNWLNL